MEHSSVIGGTKDFSEILAVGPRLNIPYYQREYDWDINEVAQLVEDLYVHYKHWSRNSNLDDRAPYFTGTIVIHNDKQNNIRNIVDGQQRLTTMTVIACALRDMLDHIQLNLQKYPNINHQTSIIKHPIPEKDFKLSIQGLQNKLIEIIHDPDESSEIILNLKQYDEPRLDWIRKPWGDKSSSLCPETFEWRKMNGGDGLPSQPGAPNPKKIYMTYLFIWKIFAQKKSQSISIFDDIGFLECKGDESQIFPFQNKANFTDDDDKQDSWSFIEDESQLIETLNTIASFIHTIKKIAITVQLVVKDEWQAYTIFDRANTAGKKLAMIDIIRAKSFAILGKYSPSELDKKKLNSEFQKIYDIENLKSSQIRNFVGHYISMLCGEKITGQENIKNKYGKEFGNISSKEECFTWVNDFTKAFKLYVSIFLRYDNTDFPKTNALSSVFSVTKFVQHRPIILKALVKGISDQNISELHKCCESIYTVHMIANNNSPSEIESLMADSISLINSDDDVSSTLTKLVSSYKGTKEFYDTNSLSRFTEKLKKVPFTNAQGQFVLRNLLLYDHIVNNDENQSQIGDTGSISISYPLFNNPKETQLEHILPKSPKQWGAPWYVNDEATEEHTKNWQKIGNMLLFNAQSNKIALNKTFEKKKLEYAKTNNTSDTKAVAINEKWGKKEINKRTNELVKKMEKWWIF